MRGNTASGAVGLALEAIDIALSARDIRAGLAREFQSMHPAIVTVANVGRFLEKEPTESQLPALRRSLIEGHARIAGHVAEVIPRGVSIITLSHSSTVEASVREVQPGRIYVLESLPGGEGRAMADRVGGAVIPDAKMARAAEEVDCAVVGIDAYDRSGALLHKVGTFPLALRCAHLRKPFYAAGHSFKLAPGDTSELLAAAGGAASNFDRTPPELISAIITEAGVSNRQSSITQSSIPL